jgi:hypothetical protein
MAGFLALSILWRSLRQVPNLGQVSTGGGVLLVFLALLAVTGLNGKLPELLHTGRFLVPK